jgi:cysteinyl-tRNA synthetase
MAMKYLGKTIDIHTGGIDHLTVHHPNEIAQSEAATGKKFVRYWLHVNFLLVEGQKMSKSLRNIFTLEDIEKRGFSPLSFKYLILTSHYRSEMNFTWQAMASAENAYRNLIENVSGELVKNKNPHESALYLRESAHKEILNIINNDFDTPKLIAKIWDVLRSNKSFEYKKNFVLLADEILGLGLEKFIKRKIPQKIKDKVLLREKLRKEKKWEMADKIREELLKLGYKIEDTKFGPFVKLIV